MNIFCGNDESIRKNELFKNTGSRGCRQQPIFTGKDRREQHDIAAMWQQKNYLWRVKMSYCELQRRQEGGKEDGMLDRENSSDVHTGPDGCSTFSPTKSSGELLKELARTLANGSHHHFAGLTPALHLDACQSGNVKQNNG